MRKDNIMVQKKRHPDENKYIVYSDGRVYSEKTNDFLKGGVDSSGYHFYNLRINNKTMFTRTNVLIAKLFIPNPNNYPVVNHIDGNKLNNDVSNLEWTTYSDNINKYYKLNGVKQSRHIHIDIDDNYNWKDIYNFSRYEVCDKGFVRNKKTKRFIRPDKNPKYARIILIDDNGQRVHKLVHRLVYCAFHDDYNLDGFVIDHIDTNPRNNCLSNLQKITPSENTRRQERFQNK